MLLHGFEKKPPKGGVGGKLIVKITMNKLPYATDSKEQAKRKEQPSIT